MRDLIFRTCFRYKLRPRYVRGDTKYGTTDNIVALEREHIRAYVPIADLTQQTPFFRQEDFQYGARLGAASVPSRGDVCLLFGGFGMVYSSFVGVFVLFLADWIRLPNDQEAMHPSLLMSFVGVFFNRQVTVNVRRKEEL